MSYPHLPTPRQSKPRIRLHPFSREVWLCERKGDVSGVGASAFEAWQKWTKWNKHQRLK